MISLNDCREIIKAVLSLNENERLESLKEYRKKIGMHPDEFCRQLFRAYNHFKAFKLPDLQNPTRYTKEVINGVETIVPVIPEHLSPDELEAILPTLEQLQNESFIYLGTDGNYYPYPFDWSTIPKILRYTFGTWFQPQKRMSIAEKEVWEADYKKWLNEYEYSCPVLLTKGIEYAGICLKHCQQYEPKNLHQIDSLQRRIIAAKRMAGIVGEVPKSKKDPKDNHHVQALFLFYTGAAVSREANGDSVFNKWSQWRKSENRTTNGPIVKTPTKIKHLKTVLDWLTSEGRRKAATQCQQDIEGLQLNYAKP